MEQQQQPTSIIYTTLSNRMTMDHEALRARIRSCQTIGAFVATYESPSFLSCLGRLRDAQVGQNRESWAKFWAEALSRNEDWAWMLNHDRKTVTVFLKELLDRWNGTGLVTSEEINCHLGNNRIHQMMKLAFVMDRANALYNMIDLSANKRGMHWYADRDGHRRMLPNLSSSSCAGGHTMNKRYLWLLENDEFLPLGLSLDQELIEWSRPQLSPLRV